MRTATTVEAASFDRWSQQRDFAVEAEKLGLDVLWVAEAWGSDAPSALGYYAACADRMLLGSGSFKSGLERQLRWRRPRSRCPTCPADGFCSASVPPVHRSSKGCTGFRLRAPCLVLGKQSTSCVK
jgi:hypothetical protein